MSEPVPPRPLLAVTSGLRLGGSTTLLLHLLAGLKSHGQTMPIVSASPVHEMAADFSRLDADVQILQERGLIYEDRLRWAYRQIARSHPSTVVAWLGPESHEVLRLVPESVHRVAVLHSHDPGPYEIATRYAPWVDTYVGVSSEIADTLRSRPEFAGKRIIHIPSGIDFPPSSPLHQPPTPGRLRAIYLGRIVEEQKRVSRLVTLARMLDTPDSPIEFSIAGDGPQLEELRAQLAGLSSVKFRGAIPHHRVGGILREHDVFLLLSDYEGLSISLLEAMGEGLVPVVSDLPSGMAQAVPENCGIRVPVGDVAAAAAALRQLAADPDRLAFLSQSARAHARTHFSAARMAADYLALDHFGSRTSIPWKSEPVVPAPLGLNRWLFSGWPRRLRRWLKRRMASASDLSTLCPLC